MTSNGTIKRAPSAYFEPDGDDFHCYKDCGSTALQCFDPKGTCIYFPYLEDVKSQDQVPETVPSV